MRSAIVRLKWRLPYTTESRRPTKTAMAFPTGRTVFNRIRPVDGTKQSDVDGDGLGDACDAKPLVGRQHSFEKLAILGG